MEVPCTDKDKENNLKRNESHPAKRTFSSMDEYEIVQSVSLIREVTYQAQVVSQYFRLGKLHKVRVLKVHKKYVQLDLFVERELEAAMPKSNTNRDSISS